MKIILFSRQNRRTTVAFAVSVCASAWRYFEKNCYILYILYNKIYKIVIRLSLLIFLYPRQVCWTKSIKAVLEDCLAEDHNKIKFNCTQSYEIKIYRRYLLYCCLIVFDYRQMENITRTLVLTNTTNQQQKYIFFYIELNCFCFNFKITDIVLKEYFL